MGRVGLHQGTQTFDPRVDMKPLKPKRVAASELSPLVRPKREVAMAPIDESRVQVAEVVRDGKQQFEARCFDVSADGGSEDEAIKNLKTLWGRRQRVERGWQPVSNRSQREDEVPSKGRSL